MADSCVQLCRSTVDRGVGTGLAGKWIILSYLGDCRRFCPVLVGVRRFPGGGLRHGKLLGKRTYGDPDLPLPDGLVPCRSGRDGRQRRPVLGHNRRSAYGGHAGPGYFRGSDGPDIFSGLHARRLPIRLVLRRPRPVRRRHVDPGVGRQLPAAVRSLGVGGDMFLSVDWILARKTGSQGSCQKSFHRHPHRRRGNAHRHPADLAGGGQFQHVRRL